MVVVYAALLVALALSVGTWCGILAARWRMGRDLDTVSRQNLELQGMLRKQGLLAQEVAHELKNPITAVVCAAEALELLLDADLDQTQRRTLRHIGEYGNHILRLMRDFIDVSRGLSGQLHSHKDLVSIAHSVDCVTGLLAPSAGKKRVCIELDDATLESVGYVDPKHLKQIIFNVVENAVKFSPAGSAVVVSLRECLQLECITIAVNDAGPGMSPDEIATLFHPIRSDPRQGSAGEVGSGIGLMLSKTLADLEGISISVDSQPGLGTRVTLTVPARMPAQVTSQPTEQPERLSLLSNDSRRPLAGQKVLLVDSDPGVRDTLARLIEALGGAVDGVSMAMDAVDALHRTEYSAVMIDESVDGVKGSDVARMLENDPATRDVRIVLATSHSIESEAPQDSGADRWIEKPLDKRALLESLLPTH